MLHMRWPSRPERAGCQLCLLFVRCQLQHSTGRSAWSLVGERSMRLMPDHTTSTCASRTAALQLGVVAPTALEGFAQLPSSCTSLDIHGDHWEMPMVAGKHLHHLCALTQLQHLGLFHYSLGSEECEPQGAACPLLSCQSRLAAS